MPHRLIDINTPAAHYEINKDGKNYVSVCNGMEVQTTRDRDKALNWLASVTDNMGYLLENMKEKGVDISY